MPDLSSRLKELRKHHHYTLNEVAQKLDITASALSQYESGKRTPRSKTLIKIAKIYSTSLEYLLGIDKDFLYDHSQYISDQVEHISNIVSSPSFSYRDRNQTELSANLSSSKARILSCINHFSEEKQLEVLQAIELLLHAMQ